MMYLWLAPIFIGIVMFAYAPIVGLACIAAPVCVFLLKSKMLWSEEKIALEKKRETDALRIEVKARLHLTGFFITIDSFKNAADKLALPAVLYVERPFENQIGYFAGKKVFWKNLGRQGIILYEQETHQPAQADTTWQSVECELLIDQATQKPMAISTPEGLLRIKKTSKETY